MQAAQACNSSYGGHQYPHTYEHHIMMDPGWPGQQTGQHCCPSTHLSGRTRSAGGVWQTESGLVRSKWASWRATGMHILTLSPISFGLSAQAPIMARRSSCCIASRLIRYQTCKVS